MTSWMEKDGLHMLIPGSPISPEMLDQMTKQYQEEIRKSPVWGKMVKQLGQEEAERLLKEC